MNPLYSIDMPKKMLRVREAAVAAERAHERSLGAVESKRDDGTFRIRIITEGKGSSGIYPRRLIQEHGKAFDGFKSFFDHPEYSFAPEERSVLKLAGRLVPGTIEIGETDSGLAAAYADFKPREEYRSFIEEFADVLGVSIFVGATFSESESGEKIVESFDANDPYGSVDIVVAAGRGGRFESARESLRTLNTSLGVAEGHKPTVEASAEEKEDNMELEKMIEALTAKIDSLATDVAALKTAATEKATAEADAEAIADAVAEGVKGYAEKVAAIDAVEDLLESQRKALTESAAKGEDITAALESAKAIAEEAKAHFSVEEDDAKGGLTFESGASVESAASGDTDYAVRNW